MDYRRRLFLQRNPYSLKCSEDMFFLAVKQCLDFHVNNCPEYAAILASRGFDAQRFCSPAQLADIPPLPTLYFKRNRLFTLPDSRLVVKASSSGTKGSQSMVGFDLSSLVMGVRMMLRFFSYHSVTSLIPANYIILGYEPSRNTDMGAVKTAYGTTEFAPALHREYALRYTGKGYELNIEGVKKALLSYARSGFPVRFAGFPSYMYFMVKLLKENGIALKLNRRSKVLLGGGWKQFSGEEVGREVLNRLIYETLGLEADCVLEFYSAVEHPLPYVKCKNGHFHVPVYSRAFIRDVASLKPVGYERLGLLSFVSPLVYSMPLLSVVTDDLAVLHEGRDCGCGIETPFFELKGRAGVSAIKTCAADAAELMATFGNAGGEVGP